MIINKLFLVLTAFLSLQAQASNVNFNGLNNSPLTISTSPQNSWTSMFDYFSIIGECNYKKAYKMGFNKYNGFSSIDSSDICKQLDSILYRDQKYRLKLEDIRSQKGYNSEEETKLWPLINEQDSINLSQVEAIVGKYGWVNITRSCSSGGKALFLVIQHANLQTQLKYLPQLMESVGTGASDMSDYAYLIDRVHMRTGKPQIYGTQTNILDNICYVYPISDPSKVNDRRLAAGLSSLEHHFQEANVKYDPTPLTKEKEVIRDKLMLQINSMSIADQNNIKSYIDTLKKYGKGSQEEIRQKALRLDCSKKLVLDACSILDEHGWPAYSFIGIPASTTLSLIISQGDVKILERYLPLLKKQASKGEASNGYVAIYIDKIEVSYGRKQVYGSQVDNSRKQPYPIHNEAFVNKRRSKMGLESLSDYLRKTYGIEYIGMQ
jgi:hypothetical protein